MMIKRMYLAAAVAAISLLPVPAVAQLQSQNDGETFVKAVRNEDNNKAIELLRERGRSIANARDSKGETALIVAIARRDSTWTSYLLQQGADPALAARAGDTPLIVAARVGFVDAAQLLLDLGVKVDGANRMGETALIIAVQNRQTPTVRLLLERGANPDKADSAAGYSARDYARRDNRGRDLLKLIEAKKPAAAVPAIAR